MARELISREEVTLPAGLRCFKCGHHRFEAQTGVQAHFLMGRIVQVACKRCGTKGLVEG